ncbi:MAG: hypothetical protein M1814_002704 [Vezdaea aestivalis]|nr:MAG: hypothetical protein M1814_002704 [Vezdaea aestivalis]
MAETSISSLKRPHPSDEPSNGAEPQKRSRSNNGSPAPAPNGTSTNGRPDVSKIVAEARARAEQAAARIAALKKGASSTAPTLANETASGTSAKAPPPSAAAARIAELRARVAAAVKGPPAGQQQRPGPSPSNTKGPDFDAGTGRGRGGLDVGLHPRLLADSGDEPLSRGKKAMAPRFATTMANRREAGGNSKLGKKKQLDLSGPSLEETRNNPYFDSSLGPQTATLKTRYSRKLEFNQKGKYIQQANALRRQAALEQMKKRIAESSRRAGIDEDLDTEKAFLVQAPPEMEWWDENLVDGTSYAVIEDSSKLKILTDDSIVTRYIQHPVLIEPPQDKNMPAPKAMFRTKKEQAKIRRQRRMADLKEQQDKIRLGLEPAPPPKVKRGNMMRVLGEEAVKDPTAVEARVNRDIAARLQKHLDTNEERKLSKDQKHDKLAKNQEKDASKGIYCLVFKIDNLANGRHRFKISKNAEQHAMTGVCILHPKFNLVIVEGGQHSIRDYKKLMLNRIDWTENSPSRVREGNQEALASFLTAEDDKGQLKDLQLNKCSLVFEGEVKNRGFRKWGHKVCETDGLARDALTRAKYENFWTLARSMK